MPLLIAISTQAPTDADLFSVGWTMPSGRRSAIVSHVYTAPEDCELDDEECVEGGKPGARNCSGHGGTLRSRRRKAKRMPSFENTFAF
jgi:hypothetical protein